MEAGDTVECMNPRLTLLSERGTFRVHSPYGNVFLVWTAYGKFYISKQLQLAVPLKRPKRLTWVVEKL